MTDHIREIHYLGPAGTFTERAARLAVADALLVAQPSIAEVATIVRRGRWGMVPLENGQTGYIADSVSALVARGIYGHGTITLDIRFGLYRHRDDDQPTTKVVAHPAALAQCQTWLRDKGLKSDAMASNGAGLALLAQGKSPGLAALGPPDVSDYPDLILAAQDCQGPVPKQTRFLMLGPEPPADPTDRGLSRCDDAAGLKAALGSSSSTIVAVLPVKRAEELGGFAYLVETDGDTRLPSPAIYCGNTAEILR